MIYLDNNATTPCDPRVVEAMLPYFTENFANPSSVYSIAAALASDIAAFREKCAELLGAKPSEIIFNSGGTEGDNTAIITAALANKKRGNHIITTQIEHKAVLEACKFVERHFGCEITYLPVDSRGIVELEALEAAIKPTTILVSVMFANNETGVIEPLDDVIRIAHAHNVHVHSDIVQGVGKVPIDLHKLAIDYATLTAHKFHGPRGVGIFYRRTGVPYVPLITGGSHERKMRAGTENTPSIAGITRALELVPQALENEMPRIVILRDKLEAEMLAKIPEIIINGANAPRVPNTLNVSIKYIEGESILALLDAAGIYASSGSACTSGSLDPSHVLLACGLDHGTAHGSIRFSLGADITEDNIAYVAENMQKIVARLRRMSPLAPPKYKS